jgi:GTP cyclohydrolase I
MNEFLPDVSTTDLAANLSPLEWVGMQGIDLPVIVLECGYRRELHASVDAQVDLPIAHVKGIHMSRLYRLLDSLSESVLTPVLLREVLQAMVDSHHDCGSNNARILLEFDLLTKRPALVTPGLSGWKSYPARIEAALVEGKFSLSVQVDVGYSSTCPCSAALSRQLIEKGFQDAFADRSQLDVQSVSDWLREHATLATAHSQRSQAVVRVELSDRMSNLGLLTLIEATEKAVATPLQTAVKRADEQAFAALNGQNLMYVEDAARRIAAALHADYCNPQVHVRHLESLHPHDASAWSRPTSRRSHA